MFITCHKMKLVFKSPGLRIEESKHSTKNLDLHISAMESVHYMCSWVLDISFRGLHTGELVCLCIGNFGLGCPSIDGLFHKISLKELLFFFFTPPNPPLFISVMKLDNTWTRRNIIVFHLHTHSLTPALHNINLFH